MDNSLIIIFLFSMVPAVESRYSIPVALATSGMHPVLVYLICTGLNLLVIPIVFVGLDSLAPFLVKRYEWARSFFSWALKRNYDKNLGYLGLALFVAVPLPATGAYTGTVIAYLLGMDRKKASLAIALGASSAALLTTLVSLGILSLSGLFL
ncbi:MAG: hypothetical protein APU95_05890 [Hadesarchaea archaeon YNP_N21]|nr:MAG: hypothetical protein APU95_05890 [Hadesarchaea archaeon YNP_N21]